MSISADKVFNGIKVDNAVGTVGIVTIESDHVSMTFSLEWSAPDSTEVFLTEIHHCPYDVIGSNPIAQVYDWLSN